MEIQALYQKALKFAAEKHLVQKVPGSEHPYVVHLSNVAMEILVAAPHSHNFDLDQAIQIALLHDTLEDTDTNFETLRSNFGASVAEGVAALTKNAALPKEEQIQDSLLRIKKMPKEVWAVKLADRITNLQIPPAHWDHAKKVKYQQEAQLIWDALHEGNTFLAQRLSTQIEEYGKYF
jgi:guanosine-3',5'-bis(diphosphate) 3'-pyrophosphohydrolase